ncbi:MAG: hypothetical protein IPL79_10865 [Myxococcales bacterium]|nr:hypothetical protein [Myxococcales bacterium]
MQIHLQMLAALAATSYAQATSSCGGSSTPVDTEAVEGFMLARSEIGNQALDGHWSELSVSCILRTAGGAFFDDISETYFVPSNLAADFAGKSWFAGLSSATIEYTLDGAPRGCLLETARLGEFDECNGWDDWCQRMVNVQDIKLFAVDGATP